MLSASSSSSAYFYGTFILPGFGSGPRDRVGHAPCSLHLTTKNNKHVGVSSRGRDRDQQRESLPEDLLLMVWILASIILMSELILCSV